MLFVHHHGATLTSSLLEYVLHMNTLNLKITLLFQFLFLKYMIPLLIVYFAEYLINQGIVSCAL